MLYVSIIWPKSEHVVDTNQREKQLSCAGSVRFECRNSFQLAWRMDDNK